MKLKDGFITHQIQDTQMMVAAGEAAKHFHGLVRSNETAAFIVDCLKNETTEEAVVERLLEEYNVSREVVTSDVHTVIEKLKSIGALNDVTT
ncbi:MAG: PqqD family protein [Oscillospiraceae bacterium]|nr:PqqD family protein [Oscillospiraceae bacterium]